MRSKIEASWAARAPRRPKAAAAPRHVAAASCGLHCSCLELHNIVSTRRPSHAGRPVSIQHAFSKRPHTSAAEEALQKCVREHEACFGAIDLANARAREQGGKEYYK